MESDHQPQDPQLPAHSVRISLVNNERNDYLKDLSGVVVVIHTEASREHYHIYWQHEKPITRKTFVKHLKKINVFSTLKGQKDFSVTDPNSLDGFWKYTMSGYKTGAYNHWDDKAKDGARCLYWNHSSPRRPDYPTRDLIHSTISYRDDIPVRNVTVKPINKNDSEYKKAQWILYCRSWYKEFPETDIDRDELTKLIFAYSKGAFNKYRATEYVDHAMYVLLRDAGEGMEVKFNSFRNDWCRKIMSLF